MSNYKRKEVFDYLTRKPVTTQDIELARTRIQTPVTPLPMQETSNEERVLNKQPFYQEPKELVQDDTIRGELNAITGGELEFSNTPYIKHRNQNFERDEYRPAAGRWQGNRNNNNRGGRGPSGPGGGGGGRREYGRR